MNNNPTDNEMPVIPGVAVLMQTYNHEKWIQQAIEGVLFQKTNFPVQLIISDDCSTDQTFAIASSFTGRNNIKITVTQPDANIGAVKNGARQRQQGIDSGYKYIAICEGDDYWTDENKLQKQVDFLEANPDFSLCFHDVYDLYENNKLSDKTYCNELHGYEFTIYDVINFLNVPTLSVVFRNRVVEFPSNFVTSPIGDWPLFMLLAEKGKFKFINSVMGIYRKHGAGMNSVKPPFVQNENKIQSIEIVMNWFKEKELSDVVRKLRVALSKAYYYQSLLLLNLNRKQDSIRFYKKMVFNTPLQNGLAFKLKYPVKLLGTMLK